MGGRRHEVPQAAEKAKEKKVCERGGGHVQGGKTWDTMKRKGGGRTLSGRSSRGGGGVRVDGGL